MQLEHFGREQNAQIPSLPKTEVIFADYEHRLRAAMCQNLPDVNVAYDETVFPERIILIGFYERAKVDEIIFGDEEESHFVREKAQLGHRVEDVKRNDYL